MKKWSTLFIALLCFSCSDGIDSNIELEEPTSFTMTVRVPGVKLPATYSDPVSEIQENDIREIDILAFKEIGGGDEAFCYRVAVQQGDIQEVSASTNGSEKMFNLNLQRTEYGVRLVVLANARSPLNALIAAGTLTEGALKSTVLGALTFNGKAWEGISGTAFPNAFPMMGQTAELVYTTVKTTTSISKVSLIRALAKVDIGVDIGGDPAIGFGKRFEIKNVLVYRASDKGLVAPHTDDLQSSQATKINLPTGVAALPPMTFPYEKDATENAMVRKIYLAESAPCVEGSESQATCLVLQATYDNGPETYYRVDFMDKNNQYLPLLRNQRYLINITQIRGDGYPTAAEAAANKSSALIYNLTVTDEELNSISYDGVHTLGVNYDLFYADWLQGAQNLVVHTNYSSGWTLTADSWITVATENQQGVANAKKSFAFTVSRNTTGLTRTGKITLKAGRITKEIAVVQSGGSNCIIVPPGGTGLIPLMSANADGTTRVTPSGSVDMSIVWQDGAVVTNLGAPQDGNVSSTVTVGGAAGNAVVAVRNAADGTILWSWHIWVTSHDINASANQKKNNNVTFMDRNLGAKSMTLTATDAYGMFYQWGRKDPFPSTNAALNTGAITYEEVAAGTNLQTSIKYPNTFYTSSKSPYYSWYGTASANNNLWVSATGGKTAYDPCPFGWRVPVSGAGAASPWFGYTAATAGAIYPLSGGRSFDEGKLVDAGFRGYAWGATPYSFTAYGFNFTGSVVNPSSTAYRANAYPVRCVKVKE